MMRRETILTPLSNWLQCICVCTMRGHDTTHSSAVQPCPVASYKDREREKEKGEEREDVWDMFDSVCVERLFFALLLFCLCRSLWEMDGHVMGGWAEGDLVCFIWFDWQRPCAGAIFIHFEKIQNYNIINKLHIFCHTVQKVKHGYNIHSLQL